MTLQTYNLEGTIYQDTAYTAHREIVALSGEFVKKGLELGQALYHFNKDELWRELEYPSFHSYLADPHNNIAVGRAYAYRLMGVYETFVVRFCLAARMIEEAGPDKLALIQPFVDEENVEEWANEATVLSRSDLRKKIKQEFGGHENGWDEEEEWKMLKAHMQDYIANSENEYRVSLVRGCLE